MLETHSWISSGYASLECNKPRMHLNRLYDNVKKTKCKRNKKNMNEI